MFSITQQLDRAAEIFGTKIAVRFEDRQRAWAEVHERVTRFSSALRSIGVRDGQRVAMLANNNDVYFEFFFAVPRAGGIAVPINTRLAADEFVYWLTDSGSEVLLVDATYWDVIQSILPRLTTVKHVLFVGDGAVPEGAKTLDELMQVAPEIPDAGHRDDDVAILFYTGGTTGNSKGVMQTHKGLIINIMQWTIGVGVKSDERMLIVAPMFHMVAGLNCLIAAIMGASVTILPRFDAKLLLDVIERDQITNTALVPIMINRITQEPGIANYDLSSLRGITYGGAPMPDNCLEGAMRTMPHVNFFQVYGQTEGGPTISILGAEYHVLDGERGSKRMSAGRPIPCVEVRIFDEDGQPLPRGELGEICVRSPSMSPGYWNNPAETESARRDGWLRTGDAGYLDEDGFLYIVDRLKDMIVSGGENVYSAEVENVLSDYPSVLECAVIAVPHEEWGEAVHGIVRLRPGQTAKADDIIQFCKERLAGFKSPRSIEFREEPFPLSGANKILKKELRAPHWAGRSKAVN